MKTLSPFIILIVCIIMYFMYITPLTVEVKGLAEKKVEYDDVLLRSEEIIQIRESIKSKYASISQSDFERLNKIMPATFNPVLFINDISVLANQNGMSISNYEISDNGASNASRSIETAPVARAYVTNVVSLSLEGRYENFVRFLSRVESSLQLIDVIGLTVRPLSGTSASNELFTYVLEFNTYSLK